MSAIALPQPANDAEVGATVSGREAEAAHPTRAHLQQAIRSGDASLLPTRRDEAWRWTDLRAAVRILPAPSGAAEAATPGPFAGVPVDREVVVVNGRPAQTTLHVSVDETMTLRFLSQGYGSHAAELSIEVAPGASLTLLESYEGEGAYLAGHELTIRLGKGSACERLVIEADAPGAVSVSTADVVLSANARFAQTVATSGAGLQRHETRVRHPGEGAHVRMDALYHLADRHADLTTVVEHHGRDGATSQLAKGVAAGRARAVFQGRIVVAQGSDGTDARMRHSALILNDGAEVDAKPELEIYADDVQCAHGNTIGALDEDALFYIRSRGLSETEARALLMHAFLGEVVERVEHTGGREVLAAWLEARLNA